MSIHFRMHPLALALAAAALAAAGSALAAPAGGEPRAAPSTSMPDTAALVAQAHEMAERTRGHVMLALNEELQSLQPSLAFIANEFGNPREIVKNAPYSAEAVTETIQVLPDGNRIVRKTTTLLARDGAGRTRQERKGDDRSGTFIYDPIDGRSIVLNETSKTATRLPRVPMTPEPPMPPIPAPRPCRRCGPCRRSPTATHRSMCNPAASSSAARMCAPATAGSRRRTCASR